MSCPYAHDAGAYVLGSLAPGERLDFEQHLADCDSCGADVRGFAGMGGLLGLVAPDVWESLDDPVEESGPPATLLPALVSRVRRDQRRRRWTVAGAAAAAAVVVGSVGAAAHWWDPEPGQAPSAVATTSVTPGTPRAMQRVGNTSMTASLALTQVQWGTRLDLTCSYPAETGPGHAGEAYGGRKATYSLVVTTRAGAREKVATWHATVGRTMQLTAATATSLDQIAAVQLEGAGGSTLLRLAG